MSSFNVSDSAIAVQMSMEKAIESVLTMLAAQDLNVDQETYPLLSASQKEFLRLKGIVSNNETKEVQSEVSGDSWVEDKLNESTMTAVEAEEERPASVMTAIEKEEEEQKEALFLFKEPADDENRLFCYRFFNMTSAELEEELRRARANRCSSSEVKISDHSKCSDESDLVSDDKEEETESEIRSESDSEETDSEEESEESQDEEKEEEEETEEQEDIQTSEAETTQAATSEAPEAPKTDTDRWEEELSMKILKMADQSSRMERMLAEMKKAWSK